MKYVILGSHREIDKILFLDAIKSNNVDYFEFRKCFTKLEWGVYLFHHSTKLNRIFKLPGKKLWIKKYIKFSYKTYEKIIFIYFTDYFVAVNDGLIKFLRQKYPNSRHISYSTDIHAFRNSLFENIRNEFDDCYIFDEKEAEKQNITYYPLPYSKVVQGKIVESYKKSDLYFVGQAKSRYNKLIEIFEYCEKNNIVADFYIIGVPLEKQLYKNKIHYIDFIPYDEVLSIISRSNCGVELILDGVTSYSNRVQEALINGKKIISDNPYLKDAFFYNEEVINIFDNVSDIDPDFIITKNGGKVIDENIFSPLNFLKMIKEKYYNIN